MTVAAAITQLPEISALVALTATLVVAAWLTRQSRPVSRGALLAVAIGALSFQVFHAIEHLFQLGQWVLHPDERPWMSEWAMMGVDTLSALVNRPPATGNELLHLAGNTIFMTGLVAGGHVLFGGRRPVAWVWAERFQAVHLVEHVVLSVTSLTLGRSVGATTLVGTLDPTSTTGVAVRVCSHFVLNAIPTLLGAHTILRASSHPDQPTDTAPSVPDDIATADDRTAPVPARVGDTGR